MYPDSWGTGFSWPERWIDDHLRVARELGKPTVLEEYGLKVVRDELGRITDGLDARLAGYKAWNERVLARGGSAAMFWLLAGQDENGGMYPDYDRSQRPLQGTKGGGLLQGFARRFTSAAPACSSAALGPDNNNSPFVHVRNRRLSAFGWRTDAG